MSFNVYLNEDCKIYADEVSTVFERGIDDYAGTYELKGNVLNLSGDLQTNLNFKFLNSEKTKFQISGGDYIEIYVKEQ